MRSPLLFLALAAVAVTGATGLPSLDAVEPAPALTPATVVTDWQDRLRTLASGLQAHVVAGGAIDAAPQWIDEAGARAALATLSPDEAAGFDAAKLVTEARTGATDQVTAFDDLYLAVHGNGAFRRLLTGAIPLGGRVDASGTAGSVTAVTATVIFAVPAADRPDSEDGGQDTGLLTLTLDCIWDGSALRLVRFVDYDLDP